MPFATAALDERAGRRITAAAIALALQGAFYWLILRPAIQPAPPPVATPLEVTLLQAARRLRPALPPPKHLRAVPRLQAAPATRQIPPPAEMTQPITVPWATKPAPRTPIDWQRAMQGEVRAEESGSHAGKLQFGFPQPPPASPAAPWKFGWDYAQTHRIEALPDGGLLINLTDRCALVAYLMLIPVCKIGKMPANGQLFDHIHDPRNDRPGALP